MKPMTARQALLAFDRIDSSRETQVTGNYFKQDEQLGMVSETLEGAIIDIPAHLTFPFIQAIRKSSIGDYVGRHIQAISQNKKGEFLLTSWVDFIIFSNVDFSNEIKEVQEIIERILKFKELKVNEVVFSWVLKT